MVRGGGRAGISRVCPRPFDKFNTVWGSLFVQFPDSPEPEKPANPLAVIRSYLALAIQIGAPAYNYGDHRGCYEVYLCTGRMLLHVVEGAEEFKQLLRQAIQRAASVPDVTQQAWIMRHAFDSVLGKDSN